MERLFDARLLGRATCARVYETAMGAAGRRRRVSAGPGPERPVVVVVAEASPMRGGIATFAETITADPRLARTSTCGC